MPLAGLGKNVAINAVGTETAASSKGAKFLALLERTATVEGWGQASTTVLEKAAHGLVDNDLIWFTEITGGAVDAANPTTTPGIILKRTYYVKKVSTSQIELRYTRGGTTVAKWNTTVTAGKCGKYVEITGGSYARVATAFSTATIGIITDAARKVKVKGASQNVDALAWFPKSKESEEGSSEPEVVAVLEISRETFSSEGELEVTASTMDLLANGNLA